MRRRTKGTGSVFQRGKLWWIQYINAQGEQRQESSQSESRNAAEKLLHQRLGGHQPNPEIDKVTINHLIDLVIADYQFRKLRSVDETIARSNKNLRPALGKLPAGKFSRNHYRNYVERRREQSAEDATINRELAVIRRGFTLGYQAEPQLVVRTPFIPILEEDNARQGFLEPEDYAKLLEALPLRLKALFVCAYHVGTRKGELRKLEWSQVDFDARLIRLTKAQTKGKEPRTLPIYGDMEYWLRRQWEHRAPNCRWVFYHHGRPVGAQLWGWHEACKEAGQEGLLFHDLRRSAVRNMKRAPGNSNKSIMAITGHKTESIFNRYDIISEQDIQGVAERTEKYLRTRREKPEKLRRVK